MSNSRDKLSLSVFIITLNEAQYLAKVLESVSFADDIVVVDSGSDDGTCDIVQQHGARLIHQSWLGFAKQKAFAMQQCKHDWVLNIDGDEILPDELRAIIESIVNANEQTAYELNFEDIFWGEPTAKNARKRHITRLFRKQWVSYPEHRMVHENVKVNKNIRVKSIPIAVSHYGYESTTQLMEKQNKYAYLKAQEKYNAGKRASLFKLAIVFPLSFLKSYVLQRKCLSGRRGFVQAYIDAMYGFLKEANLQELAYRDRQN